MKNSLHLFAFIGLCFAGVMLAQNVPVAPTPTPIPPSVYPDNPVFPREIIVTVVGQPNTPIVEILGYPSDATHGNPVYLGIYGMVTSGPNKPLTYAAPKDITTETVIAYDAYGVKWVAGPWVKYAAATLTPTPIPTPTPLPVKTAMTPAERAVIFFRS